MRSIVIISSIDTQNWKFCFNHHGISYKEIDFWDDLQSFSSIVDSTVIIDFSLVDHLVKYQFSLLKSLLSTNTLIAVSITDAPVQFQNIIHSLEKLDQSLESKNLICVLECEWNQHNLQNIKIINDTESPFFAVTEQRITTRLKKTYDKDFLLCMGRKDPSRDQLWQRLLHNKNSIMIYHSWNNYDPLWPGYLGENSAPMAWQRAVVPSLDFYNQCSFEIAAETFVDRVGWFTEKTIKPIAAKTPFLLLGVPGALKSLKKMGFRTFGNLIDESYDLEHDLSRRIEKISESAQYIIDNGSKEFAISAQEITEHNWNRLFEIKSRYEIKKDQQFFNLVGL